MTGKKRGAKHGPHVYDWATVRKEYVEGWQNGEGRHLPTLEELSKKHKVGLASLWKRSAAECWPDARKVFSRKITAASERKSIAALSLYGVRFDRGILAIAEQIAEQVRRHMARYMPSEDGPPPLCDPVALRNLAGTLKLAHEVAHAAIGDTPGVEFEEIGRDPRRRILMHVVPKPPPDAESPDHDGG